MIDILGYLAMALVGISFVMKDIKTLRLFNLVGASIFIVYGILLCEPPIYILNSFIVIVNLYYLFFNPKPKK